MTAPASARPHRRRVRAIVGGYVASLAVQIALVALGVAYVLVAGDRALAAGLLVAWCAVGTAYAVGIWIVLALAGRSAESDRPPLVLELGLAPRIVSLVATVFVSLVGVTAAVHHVLREPRDELDLLAELVGVWAMLLAWMLLHWFFAQLYLQLYYREAQPPLAFPGTRSPGILEFAYFSYTVGVSLAVSDVEVRDRRMRLRVLTHAVVGFFFNGSIIVIALGTIAQAGALLRGG